MSAYNISLGRPAVIVIDDTNHLATHVPGTLEKLQEKAKLWADTNIAKVKIKRFKSVNRRLGLSLATYIFPLS